MSNTPLVKTSGRLSSFTRKARSAALQIFFSKAALTLGANSVDVLEQLDDSLDAARGARDFDRVVGFLVLCETDQVDYFRFGHDFDVHGVEFSLVDDTRFDFRRDERIVGARRQCGNRP